MKSDVTKVTISHLRFGNINQLYDKFESEFVTFMLLTYD